MDLRAWSVARLVILLVLLMLAAGCRPSSEVFVTQPNLSWFVAPWGSDEGEGSWEDPFASVRGAARVASPGDAIWLRGGVYDRVGENVYYTVTLYGTADAPISIRSYPGERAILDGHKHPRHPRTLDDGYSVTNPLLFRVTGDHLILEDITLRNGVGIGLHLTGYHNVFRRIKSHHHHSVGVYLQGSYNLFEYIEAFDNNSVSNGGNSANGIAFVDGNEIRTSHGPDAETRGNVVRYALLYRNSDDGIGTRSSLETLIEYSVAFDNGIGPTGNGRGFKLGGDSLENTGTVVRHNIAWGNYINFDTNGSTGITLHHNTSFDATSTGFVLTRHSTGLSANVAHNNVSYWDKHPRAIGPDTVDTSNSWNLGITEPQFLSLDPASPDFLALRTDSPLVDAGLDLGFDFAGSAPDIGALQLHQRWTNRPTQ